MPTFKNSKGWQVVVFPLYHQERILELLQRISPLITDEEKEVKPADWWKKDTCLKEYPKVVVVVFQHIQQTDPETLASQAGKLLEERHDLILSWAAGTSGKKVYMVIKTLAVSQLTGKDKFFKLTQSDITELRRLLPKKERLRERR